MSNDLNQQMRQETMQLAVHRDAPKICKDCAHYRINGGQPAGSQHRCNRPLTNLVTGQITPHDVRCEDERTRFGMVVSDVSACGPHGTFWEPRA